VRVSEGERKNRTSEKAKRRRSERTRPWYSHGKAYAVGGAFTSHDWQRFCLHRHFFFYFTAQKTHTL